MSDQILVIVPCYNEEKRLEKKKFIDFAKHAGSFQFLFVDDGSRDGTYSVLAGMQKELPEKMDVLKLEKNSGKAEAVRRGFIKAIQSSKANLIAFWDADLATPLEALPNFSALFHQRPHVEMVFGSRVKLLGRHIERRAIRHYLGRVFATAASMVLNLSVYDTQCGAKMFRRTETLAKLFQEKFHSKWIFDVEIIARYLKLKKGWTQDEMESTICEFPLPEWRDVRGSKVRPFDFMKAFVELLIIFFHYRF